MHTADESESFVTALLADAEILADYDAGQAPTAAERIARALARNRPEMVVCDAEHSGDDEGAGRHLDLISARTLNTPQAAASLSRLGITDHAEPEGAMVFACLLHVIGREEGARFWWQFAAGSGSIAAAQCLALYYERLADYRDAYHWRGEAARLLAEEGEPEPITTTATGHSLVPEHVAKQLLEQCQRGVRPRLPAELEEVVNRLVAEDDDDNLGTIHHPVIGPRAPGTRH